MTDIDRLFQSLQADADLVPSPDLSVVRALGRRRRLRRTAGVVATTLLAGTLIAGAAIWPSDARRDVSPPAANLTPLRPIGGEAITFGTPGPQRLKSTSTATLHDQGFVLWQRDDLVPNVAAVDLATGRVTWGPITFDAAGGAAFLAALPDAVAVITPDAGTPDAGPFKVTALDPASGAQLWRRDFHAGDTGLAMAAAIVIATPSTGTIQGVDWRSGETLWTVTDPSGSATAVLGMRSADDVTGPDLNVATYSDHRIVVVGSDTVLRMYDVRTGALIGSRPAVGNEALAYDGTVFAVRDATSTVPNEVVAYPAIGTDPPRTVYRSPHGTSRLRSLIPCGERMICLVEGYGTGNGADAELVAVNLDSARSEWRTNSGDLDALSAMGGLVLGRSEAGLVGLYGPGRASVLVPENSKARAVRIDSDRVLILRPGSDDTHPTVSDTEVVGVIAATGEQVSLGRVPVSVQSCSWDPRSLLCATDTGFQVWRFAE